MKDEDKRVDYVLAYTTESDKDPVKREMRESFEESLMAEGLESEHEDKADSQDGQTYFLKLHAPWNTLISGAQLLNLRKRIKLRRNVESEKKLRCCDCFHPLKGFQVDPDIVPVGDDFFTVTFNKNKIDIFNINWNNPESFFTNAERSLIVKVILDRTRFTSPAPENRLILPMMPVALPLNFKSIKASPLFQGPGLDLFDVLEISFGIQKLLSLGVYTAAFPLHESQYCEEGYIQGTPIVGEDKDRQRLYEAWARPGRWCHYQPLHLIRKYFGEKIAIYFAWLGFYTFMLIPASFVGVVAFIYGLSNIYRDIPSNDICNSTGVGDSIMCPKCDRMCSYWRLSQGCTYARLTFLFDNKATVLFAFIMAIWTTVFLEFWKRRQQELQYEWDLIDFDLEERLRPEFELKVKQKRQNPITLEMEPYQSWSTRLTRTLSAYSVVLMMITLVIMAILGVIVYRIIIVGLLHSMPYEVGKHAKIITSLTAAIINLTVIMALNVVYARLAKYLTEIETPRTYSEYEDSLTLKMFLFQFVNFYGSTFYIAFFKGNLISHPGSNRYYLFGRFKQDDCDPAGCIVDLFVHLSMVMVGKQFVNNMKEILVPMFSIQRRQSKSLQKELDGNEYMRWEHDHDLEDLPELPLFDDYLEMVVQFGFVTIFVSAFPLAPLFALLNNIIEVRLDAYKFVAMWKRPPAYKAHNIGIWYEILQGLSFIAVLSNAFIIAYTSQFIPKITYQLLHSKTGTLEGYFDNSLSYILTKDLIAKPLNNHTETFGEVTECRYSGYRHPPKGHWSSNISNHAKPYTYTSQYWHIFAARLVFVIIFEHVCFLSTWLVVYIIPDVSGRVRRMRVYDKQLIHKLNFDATFADTRSDNGEPQNEEQRTCSLLEQLQEMQENVAKSRERGSTSSIESSHFSLLAQLGNTPHAGASRSQDEESKMSSNTSRSKKSFSLFRQLRHTRSLRQSEDKYC
ncbi:hypothetical protein NP493_1213g00013 [Ridgeia piscesae]|uniref:Anoctamin n=1 Tax=Ridgeia piscesae TaxID=27915 RepID=A0AAD9KCM7_RIDPI|nr:hypothetical protein NP493_1213g00013 [Ridgeia piscesae]